MNRPIEIVPSVLPADFSRLGEECVALEAAGVDRIQWDVMDGNFVQNITFGSVAMDSFVKPEGCIFDTHLMVLQPEKHIPAFAKAGSDVISIHVEATEHLQYALKLIP